jgi:MbtH protein
MIEEEEDTRTYKVVINYEEHYSIWFADKPIPAGWTAVGKEGPKSECLAYIDEAWTDMRPLSLRKSMAERGADRRQAGLGTDLRGGP